MIDVLGTPGLVHICVCVCPHAWSCVFAVTFNLLKGSETTFSKSLSGVGAQFRECFKRSGGWTDWICNAVHVLSPFISSTWSCCSSVTLHMWCRGAWTCLSEFSIIHKPVQQPSVTTEWWSVCLGSQPLHWVLSYSESKISLNRTKQSMGLQRLAGNRGLCSSAGFPDTGRL